MWLLLLSCLLAASHLTSVDATCDACIHNLCYRKIIVLEHFEQLGQLAIDRCSNIFYFHVKDIRSSKSFTCAYNLDQVILNRIPDVDFSFARAVDETTRDVYISEETGVLKVNPNQNYTDGETVFDATVWQMQFKDKLYYTEFTANGIKTFEKDQHKDVEGLSKYKVDDFIVDKDGNIFFMSDYSLYRLKNGETEAKLFADEIYSLTTDKYKEAYFIQPFNKGLYRYDYAKEEIVEIGAFNVGTPYRAVFTSDNYIIYSDVEFNGMYLLLPGTGTCSVKEVGSGKTAKKNISANGSR